MQSTICKNCNHHFRGNFCPQCGQAANIHAVDAKYFLHDIPHSVLHVDKGFWYTFKALFTSPGKMLASYIAGRRVQHFRPFAYVLILSAVYVFLSPVTEHLAEQIEGRTIYLPANTRGFFEKYISVLIFILIPFLSLVTWLSFKKHYSYWEHFLINTYLGAQTNILLAGVKIFGLLKIAAGMGTSVNFTFAMILFMFYYSFAFVKLTKPYYTRLQIMMRLLCMNFLLASIYMTAFSLTGIMTPWWAV